MVSEISIPLAVIQSALTGQAPGGEHARVFEAFWVLFPLDLCHGLAGTRKSDSWR